MAEDQLPSLEDLNKDLPSLADLNSGAKKKSTKSFTERVKEYFTALSDWWNNRPEFPSKYQEYK